MEERAARDTLNFKKKKKNLPKHFFFFFEKKTYPNKLPLKNDM